MPTKAELMSEAEKAAAHYGIPRDLFLAQIQQESSFNPTALPSGGSLSGPAGIAQFIPETGRRYGVHDRFDPVASLWGAAAYDADLYKQTGSWDKTLKTYGTVPATGALTASQQAILTQAQTLDQSGTGTNPAGGNSPPQSAPGSGSPPQIPPAGAQGSGAGAMISNFFVRAGVILLGIMVVWQGLAMLRGSSVTENITVVKNKFAKGAKEAAA